MNDVIPNRSLFGRPFKPVALGVTILMIGLVVIPSFNLGSMGRDAGDWIVATPAAAAAVLLTVGWVTQKTKFAEWGLAVATFAYLMRAMMLVFTDLFGDSVLLALGVLVIISGSYVMEANDRRVKEWTR